MNKPVKFIIIGLLIASLLFFPSPQQNFLFYFPWLVISILIGIKLLKNETQIN